MAESPASLRRKIGSAADLQSVVRAMKAQAAATVGPYERAVAALDEYARTVELGLGACFRADATAFAEPPQQVKRGRVEDGDSVGDGQRADIEVRAVVFGSDQGLVGRFNDIVVEHMLASLGKRTGATKIWTVGDRVRAMLTDSAMPITGSFPAPGSVEQIAALVGDVLAAVATATMPSDVPGSRGMQVLLFYNRPALGAGYEPTTLRLLPLDTVWRRGLTDRRWPTGALPEVMGDKVQALRALIREYLFVSIFRACADSLASEQASRLAAMDRADRNIDTLLAKMNSDWHRLRQSDIDEELSDVVSGAMAQSRQ